MTESLGEASSGRAAASGSHARRPERRAWWRSPLGAACAGAVLLGLAVRAYPVVTADFPLNDGGLFYLMTDELRDAAYRLPGYTTYNDARIPFAYSPFGFYAAAATAAVTGLPLIDVFRYLPLLTSTACIVAFIFLARAMLATPVAVGAAAIAFALVPRSFVWLIMGGGLTRAFGFLFTILAVHQMYLLYSRRQLRYAVAGGAFHGLTVLSHLGTAPFLTFSIVVLFLARGRHRAGVIGSLTAALVALVVSAPWWGTILATHGIEPFIAASQTGGSILSGGRPLAIAVANLARFGTASTGEPLFPILGVLALFGALASLPNGRLLLPVWWVGTFAVDARAAGTYATIPMALLAGVAVSEVLLPLLRRGTLAARDAVDGHARSAEASVAPSPAGRVRGRYAAPFVRRWLPAAVVAFFIAYAALGAVSRDPDLGTEVAFLTALSPEERAAMRWVAEHTPPESRVFVVPETGWPNDKTTEWFPVLAKRVSVATVQGTEWLPDGAFARYSELHADAIACGGGEVRCLEEWATRAGTTFTHVFVAKTPDGQCCGRLRRSLERDASFERIYEGAGASIYARRSVGAVAPPVAGS